MLKWNEVHKQTNKQRKQLVKEKEKKSPGMSLNLAENLYYLGDIGYLKLRQSLDLRER